MSFEECWEKILKNAGEQFHTIEGLEFTYSFEDDYLIPSRADFKIPKNSFEKVFNMIPVKGPGEFPNDVMGPSYVWAIMHDERIR